MVRRLEEENRNARNNALEHLQVHPTPPVERVVFLPRLKVGNLVHVNALVEGKQHFDSVASSYTSTCKASDDITESANLQGFQV